MSPDTFVPSSYFSVLIMLFFGVALGLGMFAIGRLMRPNIPYSLKLIPYECGNDPSGLPWQRITIRYFPLAILFAIFDVEVALVYLWSFKVSYLSKEGFYVMIIFLIILLIGLVYDIKTGLIDWQKSGERPWVIQNK